MCNMISERISGAYFINPSHQSVSICVYPNIARQRFGKNITMATNTCNNRRIVDRVVFYAARVVSRKVDQFFPEFIFLI
jgi:hypothetical protein